MSAHSYEFEMNQKAIWSQSEILQDNSTVAACLSAFIVAACLSASIRAASSLEACLLASTCIVPLIPNHFRPGLLFDDNPNISNPCINNYIIIIINVCPLLLETPTPLLVEVEALADADSDIDAAVAADEVPADDTELEASTVAFSEAFSVAALTLSSLVDSAIPLLAISVASAAASVLLSRLAATVSICCTGWSVADPPPRRLRRWHSSSPLLRIQTIWSNLRCEDKIWSFYNFFRPVWNESESNLKQSKIWRHNLKFFVPIWIQSETSLKPIWKTHQSEIFSNW